MTVFENWMRRLAPAAAALALTAAPVAAFARNEQDAGPLAVIAVAPAERLLGADDDSAGAVGYITKQMGHPDWGMMAKFLSAGYLKPLDQSKPWGIYVLPDVEDPAAVAFLPVADVEQVFEMIEQNLPKKPVKGEDGVYSLEMQGQTVYAKSVDGWTYVSNNLAAFENLIAQPESLIADLSKDYLVAGELRMQQVPDDFKEQMIEQMKEGVEAGLENQEDEQAREFSRQYGESMVQSVTQFFEEGDRLVFGWGVDEQEGNTYLDISFTAVPGTKFHEEIQASFDDSLKSRFSGFIADEAAVSVVGISSMTGEQKEQAKLMLGQFQTQFEKEIAEDDDFEDEASREEVKSAMNEVVAVLEKTIDAGVTSLAGSMTLDESELNVVAGAQLVDSKKLSGALERLIEMAREHGDLEENDVTVEKVEQDGIVYHVITAPVPEDSEDAREMFGEEVTVILGFADEAAYVAFGPSAQERLDAAIAASKQAGEVAVPPMKMSVSLARIMRFAADQQEDDNLNAIADSLEETNGRDRVDMTQEQIQNGARVRIMVQDGVLAAIGQAIDLYSAGQNRDDF